MGSLHFLKPQFEIPIEQKLHYVVSSNKYVLIATKKLRRTIVIKDKQKLITVREGYVGDIGCDEYQHGEFENLGDAIKYVNKNFSQLRNPSEKETLHFKYNFNHYGIIWLKIKECL